MQEGREKRLRKQRDAADPKKRKLSVGLAAHFLGVPRWKVLDAAAASETDQSNDLAELLKIRLTAAGRIPPSGRSLEDVRKVVDLKAVKLMSFRRIADELKIPLSIVVKLYDFGRPEHVADAITSREKVRRGRFSYLGPEKYEEIRTLLRRGLTQAAVAKATGVGTSTVSREAIKMREENIVKTKPSTKKPKSFRKPLSPVPRSFMDDAD